MKNDQERISVLFHQRAGEAVLSLYREFRHATTALDRQWDENVFQQQQGKYTILLKHRLEGIALELVNVLESGAERDEWSHLVSRFIDSYLREFRQKIRAL